MLRTIGTVRLDGERIRCTRWSLGRVGGAELELPLRCDVTALAAYEAACTLAREVWHPGVTLARPRVERGPVLIFEVRERVPATEMERAFLDAILDGLPRPAPVPHAEAETRYAQRVARTAPTVRPGGVAC